MYLNITLLLFFSVSEHQLIYKLKNFMQPYNPYTNSKVVILVYNPETMHYKIFFACIPILRFNKSAKYLFNGNVSCYSLLYILLEVCKSFTFRGLVFGAHFLLLILWFYCYCKTYLNVFMYYVQCFKYLFLWNFVFKAGSA